MTKDTRTQSGFSSRAMAQDGVSSANLQQILTKGLTSANLAAALSAPIAAQPVAQPPAAPPPAPTAKE